MGFPKWITITKWTENELWVGKSNRCPPQPTLPAWLMLQTHAAIFYFLPLYMLFFTWNVYLTPSPIKRSKSIFLMYFLCVTYSMTIVIYYLYYSSSHYPTCIMLHCICAFPFSLDCKYLKKKNHVSYNSGLYLWLIWRWVSTL